ncbi:DUF4232 domain-containing protein [Enterobacter kobei]|uniref:DUF4232 domain-containing protein n=2 Tax=Enterobacter cloacae complex TaxID=354276 RepID=UPI003BEEF632
MKSFIRSPARLTVLVCWLHSSCSVAMPAVAISPVPQCLKAQLSVRLDDRGGQYDGMSQSGMDLVLHNKAKVPCSLPALPELSFSDRHHTPLAVTRKLSPAMHPGPVLLPVSVGAGEEVSITLQWVSSDVFEHGQCIRPAVIALALPDGVLHRPFERMMCAASGQTGYYFQSLITPGEN